MKKVLFATTALVMSAGFASAQGIELTGGANFGLKDDGTVGGDVFLHSEIDFNIVASGTTDNGLTFGASLDYDEGVASGRDPEVFISGAFGTVTVGAVDIATDGLGLPDLGFDGIGMDDDVEGIRNAGSADVTYAYDVSGLSILVSYGVGMTAGNDAAEGDFGILLGYSFGDFGVEAGYARDNTAGAERDAMGLEASYTFDMLTFTGLYTMAEEDGVDTSGYGLNVAYALDALTISVSYGDTDVAGDEEDYGIGASYDLGGGLSLAGAVGSVDGESVFDLGVNMSF